MHEPPAERQQPGGRSRPRWKWMLAVTVLLVLAVVGAVAYLLPSSEPEDAAAPGAVIPVTPAPQPDAPPAGHGEAAPPDAPADASATRAEGEAEPAARLQPPPDGACIRLDSWRPNLADVIDCDEPAPVFEVVWSGPPEVDPPMQCHFGYTYSRGPTDDEHQVCLFPRFAVDECYSIPVEGTSAPAGQTMDEVADSLNATATPLACDAPARAPNEEVVRMLGTTGGTEPTDCPAGLRYYLENGAHGTLACLALP